MTLLLLLFACDVFETDTGDADSSPPDDDTPPTLDCAEIADGQPQGQDVPVSCEVEDAGCGVMIVQLYYVQETSTVYKEVQLRTTEGSDLYEGLIPAQDVTGAGMFYYFSAMDTCTNEGYQPAGGEDNRLHFRIDEE